MMTDRERFWRVEVTDSDGQVVSIEPQMLAGREIGENEHRTILLCVQHLLAFIGKPSALGQPVAPTRARSGDTCLAAASGIRCADGECDIEDGVTSGCALPVALDAEPLAYLMDPGAGSACDRVIHPKTKPLVEEETLCKGGNFTPLYSLDQLRPRAQPGAAENDLIRLVEDVTTDYDGSQIADVAEPRVFLSCGKLRKIAAALRAAQPDEARLREAMRFAIREIDPAPIGTAAEDTLIDAWLPQFLAAEAERWK